MGSGVTLINSARETAKELRKSLHKEGLLKQTSRASVHRFFVSDQPDKFIQIGQKFLGEKIKKAQLIDINKY
jgi:glutamate racemase